MANMYVWKQPKSKMVKTSKEIEQNEKFNNTHNEVHISGLYDVTLWRGSEVETYLSFSIRLLVNNNLNPAMFSTAMLLKKPTNPVANPIRSASVHLRIMY